MTRGLYRVVSLDSEDAYKGFITPGAVLKHGDYPNTELENVIKKYDCMIERFDWPQRKAKEVLILVGPRYKADIRLYSLWG
jgi:hypothetical protein